MWDAAALIVGIVIGSGIFATPPVVASHLAFSWGMAAVWTLGGIMAVFGALTYAELAGRFPHTGGAYVFVREAYGSPPAFVFGWSCLTITYPASIAGVSLVFTAYLSTWVPVSDSMTPWISAALCLGVGLANATGIQVTRWILRSLTGAKVLALILIVGGAFLFGQGSWANFRPVEGSAGAGPWMLALAAVLWTYEGWTEGASIAGEVKNPKRNVARALVLSTVGVLLIYLAANAAYVFVLGIPGVAASDSVAVDLASAVFGSGGTLFVTGLVLVSTLGAVNGMTVGGSRILYAMANDGLFFGAAARVHATFRTPAVALLMLSSVSAIYCLWGSFEQLLQYFVFVASGWFLVIVFSVFLHRRRLGKPELSLPWFPLPPLLYLAALCGLMTQLALHNPRNSLLGAAMLLAAVPIYFFWIKLAPPKP